MEDFLSKIKFNNEAAELKRNLLIGNITIKDISIEKQKELIKDFHTSTFIKRKELESIKEQIIKIKEENRL